MSNVLRSCNGRWTDRHGAFGKVNPFRFLSESLEKNGDKWVLAERFTSGTILFSFRNSRIGENEVSHRFLIVTYASCHTSNCIFSQLIIFKYKELNMLYLEQAQEIYVRNTIFDEKISFNNSFR
jgi:hypothetical protein